MQALSRLANIICKARFDIKAVSYTHLDVYKRQGLFFYLFAASLAMAYRKAVSYTHLDVYKRQTFLSFEKVSPVSQIGPTIVVGIKFVESKAFFTGSIW